MACTNASLSIMLDEFFAEGKIRRIISHATTLSQGNEPVARVRTAW
jgi:hypothetical protein